MESFGRLQAYLSRLEVFSGWDAWTLIPVALAVLALVAAFGYYGWSLYRRSREPGGIDWSREYGARRGPPIPLDPSRRLFTRLKFGGIALLTLYLGVDALLTGHMSGRARYSHETYTADGAPVYVAGGMLCLAGLAIGFIALFPDAEILNRPLGRRDRLP